MRAQSYLGHWTPLRQYFLNPISANGRKGSWCYNYGLIYCIKTEKYIYFALRNKFCSQFSYSRVCFFRKINKTPKYKILSFHKIASNFRVHHLSIFLQFYFTWYGDFGAGMTELHNPPIMEIRALKLRMDCSNLDLLACRLGFKSSFDSYLIACEAFSEEKLIQIEVLWSFVYSLHPLLWLNFSFSVLLITIVDVSDEFGWFSFYFGNYERSFW